MIRKYDTLHKARVKYLKQKVKEEWLKGGDSNTAYFHACLRKRRVHNLVYRIRI